MTSSDTPRPEPTGSDDSARRGPRDPNRPSDWTPLDTPLPTGELPALPPDPSRPIPRRRPVRFTLKFVAFAFVVYFFVLPLIPGLRQAATDLSRVQPMLLLLGLLLSQTSIMCYSALTKAALGDQGAGISQFRMYRIQLSTRALANIVPGGSAAASALGYRLLTLSGVRGADAGFALATAGLGSAIVLNFVLWFGLLISIPIRGVNAIYAAAALVGIVIMGVAAVLVLGLIDGNGRSERAVRWIANRARFNEDRAAAVLKHVGMRVEDLVSDRVLLRKVLQWSVLQWCFDMAALWVFIRAFGASVDFDALIVAFGLANILAAIPITPGGLGIVEATYISTLVGFGIPRRIATLGTAAYRMAQFFFPILLGGIMYLSLRVGPWSIERRDRLLRLRDLAEAETTENRVDFILRFGRAGIEEAPTSGVVDAHVDVDDGAPGPALGDGSRVDDDR